MNDADTLTDGFEAGEEESTQFTRYRERFGSKLQVSGDILAGGGGMNKSKNKKVKDGDGDKDGAGAEAKK